MPAALPFRLPPPAGDRVDLLVIAGEHSGDAHAARMLGDFLAREPGARVCALGGLELAAAGAQLLHDLTATSVVGFVEVLRHLSFFRALHAEILRWVAEYKPSAVCFIDYPGMNLRLASAMRERGLSAKGGGTIRTLFYISPQIWAWKAGRRFTMARDLDAMAVIFPFEPKCYADTDLPVEFVGHPFVAPDYAPAVHWDPEGPVLLLPGSRRQAVSRIFPILLEGWRSLQKRSSDRLASAQRGEDGQAAAERSADGALGPIETRPALALYPSEEVGAQLRLMLDGSDSGITLAPAAQGGFGASAVLTSSGTISMQCALAGIPGAIVYRASPISYLLGRWLVRVPHIGIANLILDEPMYPEFIQGAARPAALAAELSACLSDPARRQRAEAQAAELRRRLAQPAGLSAGQWLQRRLRG